MKAHNLTARAPSFLLTVAVALALAAPAVIPSQSIAASSPWTAASAPGGPGATSYLDLGRKDCLGSATTNRSRVWFTVAAGVLSDTYSPTTDNSNLSTLQFVVTDGHSFTDLQTRDMTYVARPLDGTGVSCEIVATARSGRYRIVTDYLTDPVRESVVMHTRYEPLVPAARAYRIYVRYDAMINGAGGGGTTNGGANSATISPGSHRGAGALVSYQTLARSSQTQRTYEVPVYGALAADHAYSASSSGFAGTASDGLTQLDAQHRLGPTYRDADGGNVRRGARHRAGPDALHLRQGAAARRELPPRRAAQRSHGVGQLRPRAR
jgi:glucoamylase